MILGVGFINSPTARATSITSWIGLSSEHAAKNPSQSLLSPSMKWSLCEISASVPSMSNMYVFNEILLHSMIFRHPKRHPPARVTLKTPIRCFFLLEKLIGRTDSPCLAAVDALFKYPDGRHQRYSPKIESNGLPAFIFLYQSVVCIFKKSLNVQSN